MSFSTSSSLTANHIIDRQWEEAKKIIIDNEPPIERSKNNKEERKKKQDIDISRQNPTPHPHQMFHYCCQGNKEEEEIKETTSSYNKNKKSIYYSVCTTMDENTTTNNISCNNLDLSWLQPSVVKAALQDPQMSLQDVNSLHSSLNMAETLGNMEHDIAQHCHDYVQQKEYILIEKQIQNQLEHIWSILGLKSLLTTTKKWEQIEYMTECHGQSASINMIDFPGLDTNTIKTSFILFSNWIHTHCYQNDNDDKEQKKIELPFSNTLTTQNNNTMEIQNKIKTQVKQTLLDEYEKLYKIMMDTNKSGYTKEFLNEYLKISPSQLKNMLIV